MNALSDKVAIVTGASSGIGRAAAKLFAQQGAKLVVGARRCELLDTLVAEIQNEGGEAVALAGDVKDETFARGLVELARTRFGGLDVAFNNAGTLGAGQPAVELERPAWENTLATNLTSAFLAAKHQIPALRSRGGGAIVFTSTFIGYTAALPQMVDYAASKAGLIGLTQALAVEVASQGIRVNALLPGGTDTAMAPSDADTRSFVAGLHAMKRIASPQEIAKSALFLLSDASSFTTGIALLADGGVSINRI